jgi:predicted short-subunit dehydrogenase-like oxidoreductase (DUF2520 family)
MNKKIIITNKDNNGNKIIAYLVKDMKTKFVVLNESKKITLHFPKTMYKFDFTNENR